MPPLFDLESVTRPVEAAQAESIAQSSAAGDARGVFHRGVRCAEALGPLRMGEAIQYATAGDWSAHDILAHILDHTGPGDVIIGTWAIGEEAVNLLATLRERGKLARLRILLDVQTRHWRPAATYAAAQLADVIRYCKIHAKLCTVTAPGWSVLSIGSANFTANPRIEAGSVICDHAAVALHNRWMEIELERGYFFPEEGGGRAEWINKKA